MAELSKTQQSFVERFAPYANLASQQTGLPSRVILAKLAIESNWGTQMYGNNIAGLKTSKAPAQNEYSIGSGLTGTFEDLPGGRTQIKDSFLKYASPEEGMGGFVSFLTNSGIPKLNALVDRPGGGIFAPDANADQAAINALNNGPYSTDVNLVRTLPQRLGMIPDLSGYGIAPSFNPALNALGQVAPYQPGPVDFSDGLGPLTNNDYNSGTEFQPQGEVLPREKNASGVELPSPTMAQTGRSPSLLDSFSDAITAGLEGAGRTVGNAAGKVGDALAGLVPSGPSAPAPGPYDFAPGGLAGAIGAANFGAGIDPQAPAGPAPGPLAFAGGLAAGGDTPNGSFGAGITPSSPAPAPGDYQFAGGLAAGGNVPNGSFGSGITNLASTPAPTLPPLQAATDVPSLYRNILGREGGADEVAYWNGQLAQGNSLGSLQAQFIASPEAQARGISSFAPTIQPSAASSIPAPAGLTLGPSPSQTATDVPGLYQSILGRQGGADEIAYWNGQIANGESLGSIAAKFVASPEAQARGAGPVAPSIQAPTGLTLAPSAAQTANTIEGLYTSILGRQGGPDEVAYWKGQQANGESLSSIAAKFQGSPEAQARGAQPGDFAQPSPAPGLSPLVMPQSAPTVSAGPSVQASDPIADLYRNVLGREGGSNEVGYWTNELRSGKSLDAIRNQFEASPEARSRQNPSISAPTLSPSYEAPTLAAPAASASYAAPGLSPLVGAETAPTIGAPALSSLIAPDFASPVPPPPAIQATSPGVVSPYGFGQNVSQGVQNGSFGAGITAVPQISPYGFGSNVSSGVGNGSFGSPFGISSAVSNMGMDLPSSQGSVDPYSFGGNTNVSGYDANQGSGSGGEPAPSTGFDSGQMAAGFFDEKASELAYLRTQQQGIDLANNNANLFGQQLTSVAPGNQTVYDYATGRATGGPAPQIQPFAQAPVNMASVFAPLATAAFMPRFTF